MGTPESSVWDMEHGWCAGSSGFSNKPKGKEASLSVLFPLPRSFLKSLKLFPCRNQCLG